MRFRDGARRKLRFASAAILLVCWLAACAPRVDAPAPVISGAPPERGPEWVTVQRGQTLSEIAHAYHVPMRAVAEANGLSPPYHIQIGRSLMIPGAGQPRAPAVAPSVAALPQAKPEIAPPMPPAVEQPPIIAAPLAPPQPEPPPVADIAQPSPKLVPEIAPSAAAPPSPSPHAAREPSDSSGGAPPAARGSGAFLWPVRGRVLATYGSRTDGTHNDGINIGAARGAAVQAADAGVVAYAGNELRGYGNLILVKHANGWISAYAHCDQMLVKRGEKVARGQVIARVGSTGNVSEPQLHFELRRANHPVDPREFLTPLPTAGTKESRAG